MSIHVNGKIIELDEEGFLANLDDWDEDVAAELAADEGLEMSTERSVLVQRARGFYLDKQNTPSTREIIRMVADDMGKDPIEDRRSIDKHLYLLFPHGPDKQLAKIAGLPKPLPSDTEA
ncbi:MAG: TusE/DsrC/DsvC family sulfur relay protein [Candidatus Thiodiazotropha sp. (ex Myrtea sp. 'scaly one' KF741663)]|nr:TusE/DsrC/DsvC family sulfur relay protein [Candidatus Thiodiazotropha sp. (ex Myrtea sp. 'scaly one' KF741663)]